MNLSHTFLWRKLRERKILRSHRRVAGICQELIDRYEAAPVHFEILQKKQFATDRIIWQYWAQGYENVPPVVRKCLDSVERFSEGYTIIRLTDKNLSEYLDIPRFVQDKRARFSTAFFSDLLRLMLLKTYGGIWLDATVFLSGSIPEDIARAPFFVYRRDPKEPNIKYWRNTYAYYFGWTKGFRVNMLSSVIVARKDGITISDMCDMLLLWWRDHDNVPDYFFFQILFDTYPLKEDFPLVSDTLPHYLQQSINDPTFDLMSREDILAKIPIHKLTYK